MKKVLIVLVVLVLGYFVNLRFVELAYSLGFASLKKEAILVNFDKMKVKCHSHSIGWVDEIKLENEYQACVNEHEANGYKVIDVVTHNKAFKQD